MSHTSEKSVAPRTKLDVPNIAYDLKDLYTKRSSIKGRTTKFKNLINKFTDESTQVELSMLVQRLEVFKDLSTLFQEIQSEIEVLDPTNMDKELDIREEMETDFSMLIAKAQIIIAKNNTNHCDFKSMKSSCGSCDQHVTGHKPMGFKLPILQIPKFDGTPSKWLEFRDTFSVLIHKNDKIDPIHKFHYLNSYLAGEASLVISNLEISAATYSEAWHILCQRYNNERQLKTNHLNALCSVPSVPRDSAKSLRSLIDNVSKNLRALKTLGEPTESWDTLIIHLVSAKLDSSTNFKWEEHRNSFEGSPSLKEFISFLNNRANILESVQYNKVERALSQPKTNNSQHSFKSNIKTLTISAEPSSSPVCVLCKGSHRLYDCATFLGKSLDERASEAQRLRLCLNCLRRGHSTSQCRLGPCLKCKRRHNTLLHRDTQAANITNVVQATEIGQTLSEVDQDLSETESEPHDDEAAVMSVGTNQGVLLSTALVEVYNPATKEHVTARTLLDSGSQSSIISQNLSDKLQLASQLTQFNIVGIGNHTTKFESLRRSTIQIKSKCNSFATELSCLVLPQITSNMPTKSFDITHVKLPPHVQLADPAFNKSAPVDLLIGADLFWQLIEPRQITLGPGQPIMHKSKLGWVLAGPLYTSSVTNYLQCNHICFVEGSEKDLTNKALNEQLTKFWEVEQVPQPVSPMTAEEVECEGHFIENTYRNNHGRFCVKLPLLSDPDCLGDSFSSSASELISRRGVFSRRQYGSVEQLSATDPGGAVDAVARRYRLENGNSLGEKDELFGPPSAPVLENPEFQTRWYFKYFLGKMHQNYIGVDGSREPYLLSVVQEGGAGHLRAILFNKMGAHKIYLPPSAWAGGGGQTPTRPTVKQILAQFSAIERVDKMPREITCAELQKDVLLLEEQEGSVNFKIGVMLMKPCQKTDDEMLSNEKGDEMWERFISLLGDKIRLRGWNRFRGGLDVKGDMTGSHSIYTMHQGHEIMFHVSTMLPFSKDNKQQLERKRHIGNDIVNIVFTDDSVHNTFNPQCVKSHFTHIFAVVSEVEGEGYRLSVYSDDTVPPFGPSLPCPPVFNDPQLFREFLLVKLMNGEKAAFQTPTFALKRQRTLDTLIRDIYAEHCSDHKVPMLSRRALSDVWSGGAGAGGAGAARTERFLHVGQALKLDAVLRGDAPTSLVSMGCGGSRRAPWEGRVWRSAPLPATPVCAEQMTEGRLLLSTTSNTYILEESGTTRVVLRWEGCVRAARVGERAGLFRVGPRVNIGGGSTTGGAGGAGLYALPIQELCAGAWAMRPLQDCKHARLPRTKTAHYFDLLENGEGGKTLLAVAIGKRVMLLLEESKTDNEMGFEYSHIKDIQLSETPVLIKLMDGEVGIMVVGYKHHWEVLESSNGQVVKRADNSDDSGVRRGTLVNALRIGDERDGQIVLCYNHTCHFERLTSKGLESDGEYDFHWTTVPAAVVCAFPYIMAFAEDLLEIRLVANGSLVHAACIPGLKLLCGRKDIFYVACAPEYIPLGRDIDPCFSLHDYELMRQLNKQGPYSVDEDENNENKGENCQNNRTTSENNSASSRSSSISSDQENMRPPLQRMAPVSPPTSPQVLPENSGRCVRIYKIPQSNLSAGTYQRQSVSADQVVSSYFPDRFSRPNSMRQRLAELRLDSKSRGGGEDETL